MSTTNNHHRIPTMPEGLEGLLELGLDIRWSWSHAADALWEHMDARLWQATRNPWLILQTVGSKRLEELGKDKTMRSMVRMMLDEYRQAMESDAWFQRHHGESSLSVGYFSMEYGLSESLRIYSGGLGVLAGDHLKTASDLGVPLTGIGLLYQRGYFRQGIDANGEQIEFYPYNDPSQLPITPLRDADGGWITISVQLPGRSVRLRAWEVRVGRVSLYLLDSNDPLNTPADRGITSELYGGGQEVRLQQEIALGIGGWKLLRLLGKEPQVCHLNEGHAALAILERCRSYMEDHSVSFEVALAATRQGNVFTTHTPVEAGFDRFPPQLIHQYLGEYSESLGITVEQILALGRQTPGNSSEPLNMAYLGIRGSGAVNGVSELHGKVSRKIFLPLFYRWPEEEVPVSHVTNGIHVPSWDSTEADELWSNTCGRDSWGTTMEDIPEQIRELSDERLWSFRNNQRAKLVDYARERVRAQLRSSGFMREELLKTNGSLLNPEALTIGFARRFATYKRPNLLLYDPERLIRLLTNTERPVQILIAGKAHPADVGGKAMVKAWNDFMKRPEVHGHVIFLADYDMSLGEQLVHGVDVWLNNPRRPWEASGTSGMKVLVNGGLNLSILDGWWAEAYAADVGWCLGDGEEHMDSRWDAIEAEQLYDILEKQIIPTFYSRNETGIPENWVKLMRESMARLTPAFSTNRMVREYVEELYLPASLAFTSRTAGGAAIGEKLVAWKRMLNEHWADIRFEKPSFTRSGKTLEVSVPVFFGNLDADAVEVQLYSGRESNPKSRVVTLHRSERVDWEENAFVYSGTLKTDRSDEQFSVRVIPYFDGAAIPLEAQHISWLD